MAKYRTKPTYVDAVQFDPHSSWPDGFISWKLVGESNPRDMSWGYVETVEGRTHVRAGDWIITDSDGEKYVRSNTLFQQKYERVYDAPMSEPSTIYTKTPLTDEQRTEIHKLIDERLKKISDSIALYSRYRSTVVF